MKTEILKVKGDWSEVLDDCRGTVGKDRLHKEPSDYFKKRILIAEHSPIRDISFKWLWEKMPHWVTVHWSRHKWEKYIRTQRTDRTGVPRDKLPQDEPQNFIGEANIQHLIDTMRKRLCYQSSPETRTYAEDLKEAVSEWDRDIGRVLVPNCIYRFGCPEENGCGLFRRFLDGVMRVEDAVNINTRYELYSDFLKERKGECENVGNEGRTDEK